MYHNDVIVGKVVVPNEGYSSASQSNDSENRIGGLANEKRKDCPSKRRNFRTTSKQTIQKGQEGYGLAYPFLHEKLLAKGRNLPYERGLAGTRPIDVKEQLDSYLGFVRVGTGALSGTRRNLNAGHFVEMNVSGCCEPAWKGRPRNTVVGHS